jgi:hypothetical protein
MTRIKTLSLSVILAFVMTGSVGGQTQVVAYNHLPSGNHGAMTAAWMVRGTDHFDIYYERQHERALNEIAREAERAYARVSFDLQHELAARMPLIVVQSDREMPQDRLQARELVRASGAPDRDHLLLAVEPSNSRAALLVHELTHQFAFEMIPSSSGILPWFHEALADHESGRWTSSDLVQLRDAVAGGAIPTSAGGAALDRLWGHAVFDFVAAEYGTQGIRRYLTALRNSSSPSDAVRVAFGIAAGDFDRAFQAYARTRFNDH